MHPFRPVSEHVLSLASLFTVALSVACTTDGGGSADDGLSGVPLTSSSGSGEDSSTSTTTTSADTSSASSTGPVDTGTTDGSTSGSDSTSSDTGTETGPPAGYQPCPTDGPCKILPLGDSITFGFIPNSGGTSNGGYRVDLFRLALQDGHDITFTGTQPPNGPDMVDGVPFPRNHEGISGETVQQIANRVPTPALTEVPHIVLLHAGTNDLLLMPNGIPERLGALIDELVAEAPDALVVVCSVIPFNGSEGAYNATIPGLVEERANAGAHVIFADLTTGYPDGQLGDGVHPTAAGYTWMAGAWYEAIKSYLP